MQRSTEKMRTAAETARPYVERAITDDEFRQSLRSAFIAAKEIYDELVPPKGMTGFANKVAKDEELHQTLRRAVSDLRNAAERIQEEQEPKESHGFRNVLLILIGVGIGIFFNPFTGPETRRRLKGRVSGGEFSYNGHETTEPVVV